MTSFSAAAAAALELDNTSLANGVYAYHTVICLDVAHNAHIALSIVSLLMAKMQLDERSIAFTDGNEHRIDNKDLPHDKATFDSTFPTATRRKSLHCHFIIQSNRSFHNVNICIWDLLQQHRLFMDKSPGTIKSGKEPILLFAFFWMRPNGNRRSSLLSSALRGNKPLQSNSSSMNLTQLPSPHSRPPSRLTLPLALKILPSLAPPPSPPPLSKTPSIATSKLLTPPTPPRERTLSLA
jgi:hypothetical protein